MAAKEVVRWTVVDGQTINSRGIAASASCRDAVAAKELGSMLMAAVPPIPD